MRIVFEKNDDSEIIKMAQKLIIDNIDGILRNDVKIKELIQERLEFKIDEFLRSKNILLMVKKIMIDILQEEFEKKNTWGEKLSTFTTWIKKTAKESINECVKAVLKDRLDISINKKEE